MFEGLDLPGCRAPGCLEKRYRVRTVFAGLAATKAAGSRSDSHAPAIAIRLPAAWHDFIDRGLAPRPGPHFRGRSRSRHVVGLRIRRPSDHLRELVEARLASHSRARDPLDDRGYPIVGGRGCERMLTRRRLSVLGIVPRSGERHWRRIAAERGDTRSEARAGRSRGASELGLVL